MKTYNRKGRRCVCQKWEQLGETNKGHHPCCRLVTEGEHLHHLTPAQALEQYPPGARFYSDAS